ncbi:MAG: hypothetical protein GX786_01705 [Clostridiales bacterium]|nr:hypothetical protein [Clostridiales bacterium]
MYRLLVVTDQQDIQQTIEKVDQWEIMGFRKPRIVHTVEEAAQRLSNHRVDAIGMRIDDDKKEELETLLTTQYPTIPIIHLSTRVDGQIEVIQDLKLYLNRINADYSNDSYTVQDMITIEQNHFMHDLLSEKIHSQLQLKRQTNMMRLPVYLDGPCMIIEMDTPQGDEFLSARWHYGSERLEVALRNFFSNYIINYYFAIAVVSPTIMRMVICPFKEDTKQSVDQEIIDAIKEAIDSIETYLDLHITIKNVGVIEGIQGLVNTL